MRQTAAARRASARGPADDRPLRLDRRTAIEICRRIERHDLFWVEELLRDDEPLGLAVVARHTRIPVAGAKGSVALRGGHPGGGRTELPADRHRRRAGRTSFRKMAALAEAYHVRLAPHGASLPDLHAHLAAPFPTLPSSPPPPRAASGDLHPAVAGLRRRTGRIRLSDRPGLGLEFDEGYLRRHRVT